MSASGKSSSTSVMSGSPTTVFAGYRATSGNGADATSVNDAVSTSSRAIHRPFLSPSVTNPDN